MILKINDKGMSVEIEGKTYRTPVSIDISKSNLSKVLMSIRVSDIKDFSVVSGDEVEVNKRISKSGERILKSNDSNNNLENNLLGKIDIKLKGFEERLLKRLKDSIKDDDKSRSVIEEQTIKKTTDLIGKTREPVVDEDNSFFIPNINMDLKLTGSSTEKISKKEDMSEAIEALTLLTKK